MYVCVRVDLDYVPWDTPDAKEFGHAEPAVVLRMMDLARATGYKYHFFQSSRSVRALPAITEAVLNEGHDLDWLCKHPESFSERYAEAATLFRAHGHRLRGFALRGSWPNPDEPFTFPPDLEFVSAAPGAAPPGLRLFPVTTHAERDALRAGQSPRAWADDLKAHVRERAAVFRGVTVVVRPQVLGKVDPHLSAFREIVSFCLAVGLKLRTLREILDDDSLTESS